MTDELVTLKPSEITFQKQISELDSALRVANVFAQSGYFKDAADVAKACVKILAGAEMGISPFASMNGVNIIVGKPCLGVHLISGAILRRGYSYRVKFPTPDVCSIEFFKKDELLGVSTFTLAQAKTAGLAGKDNWKNYQEDMLYARAMSRGARRYCSDAFGGQPVFIPEEMGAVVDERGDFVPGTAERITTPKEEAKELTERLKGRKDGPEKKTVKTESGMEPDQTSNGLEAAGSGSLDFTAESKQT